MCGKLAFIATPVRQQTSGVPLQFVSASAIHAGIELTKGTPAIGIGWVLFYCCAGISLISVLLMHAGLRGENRRLLVAASGAGGLGLAM